MEFLASSPVIELAFSEKIPFSQKQVYHRDTEREVYFFVYREVPIDENNLSNQVGDGRIYHRPIHEDLGPVRVFVHHSSKCRGFEAELFCLSVYPPAGRRASPDKQKSSLCPRRLCGENPNLDRHARASGLGFRIFLDREHFPSPKLAESLLADGH